VRGWSTSVPRDGRLIGEELEGDDGQHGAQRVDRLWHPEDLVGDRGDGRITFGGDRDDARVMSPSMLTLLMALS
jgi:hypothetical protein